MSVIEQLLRVAMSSGSLLLLNGLSKLSTETLLTLSDIFYSIRQQFSTACLNKNVLLAVSQSIYWLIITHMVLNFPTG